MDIAPKQDGSRVSSDQGIHFHVSLTPSEFGTIKTKLSKVFPNRVDELAVISHKERYFEDQSSETLVKNDFLVWLDNLQDTAPTQIKPTLHSFKKKSNLSYFILRDQDLDFGVLEITWNVKFDVSSNTGKIVQALIEVFHELKEQVFRLYFENLYPLLMSRIYDLEQQIMDKEKSELAVDLIEGIAHSVANPLSIIFANLEITEELIAKNPRVEFDEPTNSFKMTIDKSDYLEIRSIFEDQKDAVRRITNTISELRIFSRAYKGEIENVDLNNVIKLSINFSQLRLKLRDYVKLKLSSSARVYASLFIVSQVIYNILKIIMQGINSSSKIVISTIDGHESSPPVVSISCKMDEDKFNLTQFSFIDNFMQNIPHLSKIDFKEGKLTIEIYFHTYSYLS